MAGGNAQFGGRTALCSSLSLGAASTMAGYDVYSHDDTTLTFSLDVAAASFHGEEPRLSLETPLGGGTVFGQVSGVYTTTLSDDASGLTVNNDSDDAQLKQGHLGWRTGELFGEGCTTSFSVGRQDYKIGSGMLIADGGNAWGGNLEYTFFATTKLGGTWMVVDAQRPGYDERDVYDARLDWTGRGALEGFGLSGEFARQESNQIEADGWFAQASWGTKAICWSPTFSYRYAHIDGDDPGTPEDEQFREIAYDFTVDWQATEQIFVIGVLGNLSPGDAAKEWTGGDEDWLYSMLYVSYSY